jgi:hypothetical protein
MEMLTTPIFDSPLFVGLSVSVPDVFRIWKENESDVAVLGCVLQYEIVPVVVFTVVPPSLGRLVTVRVL